jgi:hypothetical protein
MSNVLAFPFQSRKHLVKVANDYMAIQTGVYNVDDVIEVVADAARRMDIDSLVRESAKAVAKQVIHSKTTPHCAQDDWIGYGDLVIKLPETQLVSVCYAEYGALDIRKANVVENRDQIVRAANIEIQRIERIQEMMLKMQSPNAGPALEVLAAMNDFRKAA